MNAQRNDTEMDYKEIYHLPAFINKQWYKYTEGGLLSNGHLSKVDTLLLTVKNFEDFILISLRSRHYMLFGNIKFVSLFYNIFPLGRRLSLSDYHCQITIVRLPLSDYHCQITIDRLPLSDYHCQITIVRLPFSSMEWPNLEPNYDFQQPHLFFVH